MNGRRTILGLCMLCVLLVSAVAAQSASAISGTTVFTCKKGAGGGGGTFAGPHCNPGEGEGEYGHYSIPQDTTTSLRANSNGESMKLKSSVGGIGVTFSSTGVAGEGSVENKIDPSGEHYVQAQTMGIFQGVTVNIAKCFVHKDEAGVKGAQGEIQTEELTTTSTGQGHFVKFTPVAGEVITRFWVLDKNKKTSAEGGECSIGGTYTVTGSIKGEPSGATFLFTHEATTTQNTLKLGTAKAGVEGKITLESEDTVDVTDTWAPLSVTTVTT